VSILKKSKAGGLAATAAVAALATVAAWQFYLFASFRGAGGAFDAQGGTHHLWIAVGAALAACALGFVAFSVLVGYDEKDELHISTY
jgi:hypothetical protein